MRDMGIARTLSLVAVGATAIALGGCGGSDEDEDAEALAAAEAAVLPTAEEALVISGGSLIETESVTVSGFEGAPVEDPAAEEDGETTGPIAVEGVVRGTVELVAQPDIEGELVFLPGGSAPFEVEQPAQATVEPIEEGWQAVPDSVGFEDDTEEPEVDSQGLEEAATIANDAIRSVLSFDGDLAAYNEAQAAQPWATDVPPRLAPTTPLEAGAGLSDESAGTSWVGRTSRGADDLPVLTVFDIAFTGELGAGCYSELDLSRMEIFRPGRPEMGDAFAVEAYDEVEVLGNVGVEVEGTCIPNIGSRDTGIGRQFLDYEVSLVRPHFGEGAEEWYVSGLVLMPDFDIETYGVYALR